MAISLIKCNIHDYSDTILGAIENIHREINRLNNKKLKQQLYFEANEIQNRIANIKELILKDE